jgi:hypothetical protein
LTQEFSETALRARITQATPATKQAAQHTEMIIRAMALMSFAATNSATLFLSSQLVEF